MMRFLISVIAAIFGLVLLLPVLLLMAPFIFVWAAHRMLLRLFQRNHVTADDQIVEFEPLIGWRPKARVSAYALADDVYRLSTDRDGWRSSTPLKDSHIVVFGDSFAFGHGIGDEGFFANADPSLGVKAIGADGYNLVQGLMWMRRLAPHLAGKLTVWFVFLGNDIFENLQPCMEGYRTPFLRKNRRSGDWEIATSHVEASPWPSGLRYYETVFMEQLAALFVPGPVSDRLFDACRYLFDEARRTVDDAGGRLVILSIPAKRQLSDAGRKEITAYLSDPAAFDPDLPDRRLHDICAELGIPFVAGKDHIGFNDYLDVDTHWNAKGHRRIANLLRQLHQTFGPAPARRIAVASEDSHGVTAAGAIGHGRPPLAESGGRQL